jgi:hypothetical protein
MRTVAWVYHLSYAAIVSQSYLYKQGSLYTMVTFYLYYDYNGVNKSLFQRRNK